MKLVKDTPENELTIVSRRMLRVSEDEWANPDSIFERIQGTALSALIACCQEGKAGRDKDFRVLLLLDCALRVLDEPELANPLEFATPRFRELQRKFYGALGSSRFADVSSSTRADWAYTFYKIVERLSKSISVAELGHRHKVGVAIPQAFIDEFEAAPLDPDEVKALKPYLLVSKSGIEYNVLLAPLVPVLGEQFVSSFHTALQEIARPKAKDTALRDFGNTFARFVEQKAETGASLTQDNLLDGDFVQTLIVDFMEYHFMKMVRRDAPVQEGTLASLQKLWSRYNGYWEKLVSKGVLAAPSSAFPEGNPKLLADDAVSHRRVVAQEDGTSLVVTQKLIVAVPLQVTDEEATKLLFQQLKSDFTIVQEWLAGHLDEFFAGHLSGKEMATSTSPLPDDSELQKQFQGLRKADEGIALAVRYFKEKHSGYIDTSKHETLAYPDKAARSGPSKTLVSSYLGIPMRRDALALMGYLASQDGRFSESAMSACHLLDRNGHRTNAVETDGGLVLSVLKERDTADGWHDVSLTGEAAQYVRSWIEVTEPLRNYMRKHNLEGWRNLFIFASNPLGAPSHFTRSTNLYNSFRTLASASVAKLGPLAELVTIPRIRSTRGVLVFLDTMDLAAMARELGNTGDTSLRHYLPDSLWHYFSTRWLSGYSGPT